ncbi:MAG TPA: PAS domain S-box protein [Polyangia bacterium]|nr:PAS domain S-box protein [Polyangia bacterium]
MARLDDGDALQLLEAMAIPTLALDALGHVRWANLAAEQLLAWPRELLIGQPLAALTPARIADAGGRTLLDRLLEQAHAAPERSVRLPAVRRDGVEIEVDCIVSSVGDGTVMLSLQRRPESFGDDAIEAADSAQMRYRLVFEYAPLGIWHFDGRGVITACNDQFVRVIGSSKRRLIGLDQTTLRDTFVVDCVKLALTGRHAHYEGDYRSATGGKVTPVRADFAAIRDELGRVTGGVGILEDITERKRAEEALRESNAALQAIFEASPLPIVSLGRDSKVRMWNPAAESTFGFLQEEALGRPMPMVPPERENEVRANVERVLGGEVLINHETWYQRRDGSAIEVSLSAAPLVKGEGEVTGTISFISDNTERNRASAERSQALHDEQLARRAAEAAQARLEILATASAIMASSLDYDDTLQRAARMATPRFAQRTAIWLSDDAGEPARGAIDGERARGAQPEPRRVAAHPEGQPVPADAADVAAVQKVMQLGQAHASPRMIVVPLVVLGRTGGAICFARDAAQPPYDAADVHLAGEIGRRAGVAIDNARLFRRTEAALRARDEFLSIASHELRTPVTSLRLSVQNLEAMAEEGSLATAPRQVVIRGLQTSVRQSQHLSRLIDELLDISRIRAGRFDLKPHDVDLGHVARTTALRLERELSLSGCALMLDLQPALGRWDAARLDQVVTNLLTNAMKFGAGQPLELSVRADGDTATLSLTDHGIGIAPEAQARIFDRFERGVSARHYGGLGLGLFIARQIVEAHHGSLTVHSRVGHGATFTLVLPRVLTSVEGGAGAMGEGTGGGR